MFLMYCFYTQVKRFDKINNIFIVLIFILNRSIIAHILYRIFFRETNFSVYTRLLMISFFIPLTIITFKINSDIENISKKTKKLIGEYVLSNDYNDYSPEFNSLYQKFNAVLLTKPVHLTLLRFASISKTTFLFFIILVENSNRYIIH
jgi:Na+(H+)/acetate symporter ActP